MNVLCAVFAAGYRLVGSWPLVIKDQAAAASFIDHYPEVNTKLIFQYNFFNLIG